MGTIATSGTYRIDGVSQGSDNTLQNSDDADGMTVGRAHSGSDAMDGKIAFLAVYDSDVTSEDWFAEFEDGLITMYGA